MAQTAALFRNFPEVLFELVRAQTPWSSTEITYRLRNGYTVVSPNVDGARVPVFEVFAEDAYDLTSLCEGIEPDAAILDIGGQIGSFSLAIARQLPRGVVTSYEASPTSADYLARNIDANGLAGRVTVHATAVAGASGTFSFADSGTASGLNGLTAPQGLGRLVSVPAVTFDQAVRALDRPVRIVKIDVEGAEYEIILNSDAHSWADVHRVVLEYHPVPGRQLSDLVAYFGKLGLQPTRHDPGGGPEIGVIWLSRQAA